MQRQEKINNGVSKHSPRQIKTLETLAREITERGNDMEVRSSKDGLKVFEVSKRLLFILTEEVV